MSGLSLADMRRIGEERNQTGGAEKPAKQGLLSKLPFSRDADTPPLRRSRKSPVDRLERLSSNSSTPPVLPGDAVANTSTKESLGPSLDRDLLTRTEASKPLRQHILRHAGAGGAVGAVLGAVSGASVALPVGALVGAAIGNVVAKRAQHSAGDNAKTVALKPKQAPALFEAAKNACGLVECAEGSFKLSVDQSARVHAIGLGGSRKSAPKGYHLTVGLAVLVGLGTRQIEALAAHALVCAKLNAETDAVDGQTVQHLEALSKSLEKRSTALRLTRLDAVNSGYNQALHAFHGTWEQHCVQADRLAARYSGPRALVDALLAQALLAARFWQDVADGKSYTQSLEDLRTGYTRAQLDGALHCVAQERQPSANAAYMGLPIMLLERITNLDTSCSVPVLPSFQPAIHDLPESTKKMLEKRLSADTKPKKAEKQQVVRKSKNKKQKPAKEAMRSKSLFSRLIPRGRANKDLMQNLDPHLLPLYNADSLYKNDPGIGFEAYEALVEAHPRWALARLRMAEAQIEMGNPDCVANLMTCAERLPSALPTILDRLQSSLAMVSPLEEEPLRQAVARMQSNADAVALERAEIDLERLEPSALDAQDQETLTALFLHSAGLREAWVLSAPCASMPEVPHHAILGLAPRLSAEDAQTMAMALAEHAAINGTVAVHIETGTPRGALGDALATYSSIWRASS